MMWLMSCSTQDLFTANIALSTGQSLPPDIGTPAHSSICLPQESLSDSQRQSLATKVSAAVLAKARRSSVLITFDTLYPSADNSCVKTCSGTLIRVAGKAQVLTNQHCFADNYLHKADDVCAYDNTVDADNFASPCENTFAHLNFQTSTDQEETISLACQGGFASDKDLDLAIFDVDASLLPSDQPYADLWTGEIRTRQDAFLFHHPACGEGNHAMIEVQDDMRMIAMIKTITFEDCRVLSLPTSVQKVLSPQIYTLHSCPTRPGSSGAAILDAKTGTILAIHRGISELRQTNASGRGTTTYQYGLGTNIAALREFLESL